MKSRIIPRILSRVLLIEAVLLCLPMVCAGIYHEDTRPFLATILAVGVVSVALWLPSRGVDVRSMRAAEGFVSVGLSWIIMSLFGAMPFVLSGAIPSFVDAFFETVSGFTTTGASILTDVESLPRSMLFWRSFSHFIGGMGVLVFMMAVMPLDEKHSLHLMRAEMTGPVKGKLVPQMSSTAKILYRLYISLTLIEVVFLLVGGMPLYDSLLTAFGTTATGGFGIYNTSIGAYNSLYIEMVVAVFMVLSGINFNLYYFMIMRHSFKALKNEELVTYLVIILVATLTIASNISGQVGGLAPGLRYAFFQVASIMTSTGFSSANFDLWPSYSKVLLVLLMVIGACAGSTGGGAKVSRLIIMAKATINELRQQASPHSVLRITLDGNRLDALTIKMVHVYLTMYASLVVLSCLFLSVQGVDLITTFTSTIACLSNIGPGLALVGPAGNFAFWNPAAKVLLSFLMLLGRLDIFAVAMLFSPHVWKSLLR
ncbi:MAG: TrkH family potassium uptake protein [Atopobiaceae bacterium]|nr:TrkH family potassium uptake protein [Atopobiaceae bacterium]MBQ3282277.1 TrkH family potassium uptake protein [Atopobiaceae bacterium]MBQ6411647.1 TrkH family potassium uptake protein [Atopobiaceae bacterium]